MFDPFGTKRKKINAEIKEKEKDLKRALDDYNYKYETFKNCHAVLKKTPMDFIDDLKAYLKKTKQLLKDERYSASKDDLYYTYNEERIYKYEPVQIEGRIKDDGKTMSVYARFGDRDYQLVGIVPDYNRKGIVRAGKLANPRIFYCGDRYREATSEDGDHIHLETGEVDDIVVFYTAINERHPAAVQVVKDLQAEIEALKAKLR